MNWNRVVHRLVKSSTIAIEAFKMVKNPATMGFFFLRRTFKRLAVNDLMRYFCFLSLLSLLISCKSRQVGQYTDWHDTHGTDHTIFVTESMYDSIAPPKLIIDTPKFYLNWRIF